MNPVRADGIGRCSLCGFEIKTGVTQVVWSEDAVATDSRTLPPRHAEHAAMAMYHKVARRNPSRKRSKLGWTSLTLAGMFFVLAGAMFLIDLPLLHLPSGALALTGFVLGVKGLLGH